MSILNQIIKTPAYLTEGLSDLGNSKVFWNPSYDQMKRMVDTADYEELRGGAIFVDGKWRVAVWPSSNLTHWNFFNDAKKQEGYQWTDYFSFRVVNDKQRMAQEQFWVDEMVFSAGALFCSFYPAYKIDQITADRYLSRLFPNLKMVDKSLSEAKYRKWPELNDPTILGFDDHVDDFMKPGLQKEPLRGPHQGRELKLMLAGLKPLALVEPQYMKYWVPHIEENGWTITTFQMQSFTNPNSKSTGYLVSLPGEESRAKQVVKVYQRIYRDGKRMSNLDHARLGKLLGYSKEQIKFFIERR